MVTDASRNDQGQRARDQDSGRRQGLAFVLLALTLGSPAVLAGPASRWAPGEPVLVWIDPRDSTPLRRDLVTRAAKTWDRAGAGTVRIEMADTPQPRGIRVRFVSGQTNFGEALPEVDRPSGFIARADVALALDPPGDALQKALVLYLTALHEMGHALGLVHTADFATIMYRFQRPGDPERYFLRYRKQLKGLEDIGGEEASGLSPQDVAALRRLYP